MTDRIYLDVPFSEKDEAKALGARWDPQRRSWYAPDARDPRLPQLLEQWSAKPPLPEVFPSEDRSFGSGLFVDLVPSSCWFTNVRYCVAPGEWDRVRHVVYGRAGNRCEACGAGTDLDARIFLEAHERWAFDETTHTQVLRRLVCLCSRCHEATHFGRAQLKGYADRATRHLLRVTGMNAQQAGRHIESAFEVWQHRSRFDWNLDLSMLTDAGVELQRPPEAGQRRVIADSNPDVVRRKRLPTGFFFDCDE